MSRKVEFLRIVLSFVFLWTMGITQGWAHFEMFDAADQADPAFLLDMSDEHKYYVEADDGTLIYMKGCYTPETPLAKWDFYFAQADGKYVFRKVPDSDQRFVSGATKCWWKVERGGVSVNGEVGHAKTMLFDDILTDINDVPQVQFVIKGVYDVNGRKVSDVELDENSLKSGIYIVNGKKVMIK